MTDEDIDAAVATLEDAGSIDYARDAAHELAQEGLAALGALPENGARDLLEDVGIFLVERGH